MVRERGGEAEGRVWADSAMGFGDAGAVVQVPDEWPEDRMYLHNAFQQADADMSGYLSQAQVASVVNKTVRATTPLGQ